MMENLVTLLALFGKTFQLYNFDSMAVFGDSISDDGPDLMGNLHGFKKYCTGPNWADYMAKNLGAKIENYAYSGAKSDYGNYYEYDWSGGLWQLDRYLQEHSNKVPDNTLIVWESMGINDFCRYKEDNIAADPNQVAENFYSAQSKLAETGAKHILIFNIMDFGLVPWVRERQDYQRDLQEFTKAANILIAEKIRELKNQYLETNFYLTDVESMLTDIEGAGKLKMDVFDHSQKSTQPNTALEHAFFDSWHPSSAVYSEVALKGFKSLLWQVNRETVTASTEGNNGEFDLFKRIRDSIRRNLGS